MRARSWMVGLGMALAVASVGGALLGCSGPGSRFANVKGSEMPSGETWIGVYYNPVYGYLHMTEQGGDIVGRWKRTDGSHWGELSGTADGNVLQFTWKEYKYGIAGPSGVSHGSGVFVYKSSGDEKKAAELAGTYAIDEQDKTGEWHCIKQSGMKPDLGSIGGENPADVPAAQDKWQ